MTHTSSEVLTMEKSGSEGGSKMSFKPTGGWFIRKEALFLIALAYICTVIVVGVLVFYLAPCKVDLSSQKEKEEGGKVPPEPLIDVRLPLHLIPEHYIVKLKPLFDADHTIEGETSIKMKCQYAASNVTVHVLDIQMLDKSVMNSDGEALRIKNIEEDKKRQFYIVHLKDELKPGETYTIHFKFKGILNDELAGFYRSSYKNSEGKDQMIATTQFQATDARRAFPCFDEPDFKANFTISLGRMYNMSSISNMDLKNSEPEEGNDLWVWDHYSESVKMSTYLIAFVISDFKQKVFEKPDTKWDFSIYGRKQAIDSQEADYAGSIGPDVLSYFEEFYQVKYPLPKLDMIAIPDFAAGAMENWGLVTYRETALLYNPNISAGKNKKRIAIVVAHEIAHQWYGNLVTPKWWTDLWLNEGFASYVEYLGVDQVEPNWRMLDQMVLDNVQYVMLVDSLASSHPISIPVNHPDEISSIFDSISYNKGASIIRMMDFFLTTPTFKNGLTNYLNEFAFSTAEQDDLWRHLTLQAHKDKTLPEDVTVKDIMDTWTLQMGYPVLDVERDYSSNSATVSQKRFLLKNKENSTDDHEYSWWVPVTFTNSVEKDFDNTKPSSWINKGEKFIKIKKVAPSESDWVVFNIKVSGYYRVNYDLKNWKLLIAQLNTNFKEIIPLQRSQIIDDGLNLARAGELDYSIALSLTEYLHKENDYIPLASAFSCFHFLDRMLQRTSGYGLFKEFMRRIVNPLYETIDFNILQNVDTSYPYITDTFKNITIISHACWYENEKCITETKNRFNIFRAKYNESNPDDPNNQIIPDLKSVIYCNAIRHGGEEEWNFLWKHYELTGIASEKAEVLKALGCTGEVWILSSYLSKILDKTSGVRTQDGPSVFGAVASNIVGRLLAWDFLREKWDEIIEAFGSSLSGLSRMVRVVTRSFNSPFQIKQLKGFREDYKANLRAAKRETNQAIEKAEGNYKWMQNNYKTIMAWLEERHR